MSAELKKRDWHYLMSPKDFCFEACKCGNLDLQWSEFEEHVWCDKCNIDFISDCPGILDGIVMIETCKMMGFNFDSYDMTTNKVVLFDSEFWPYSEKKINN